MGTTLNPFVFMLLLLIGYQSYSVLDANRKIWCTFRRVDKSKIGKWAKATQSRINFDGGWYQVETRRITTMIKMMPLPTIVKCLDFTHDSTRALDPDTLSASMTPEERKQLDKTDDIRALEQSNQNTLAGKAAKGNALQQFMPIITIIGFLILGYLIYQTSQKADNVGFAINTVQVQLGKIMQNGGIK